jgi:3-hydroxyacyl-CoA dehydrogenase/enoyl-CoA hydratase/3-hydroxybutyryl-CoA epimerase
VAENTIQWDKDADGIVTLTLDDPTGSANVMNEHYAESMHNAVERLVAEKDSIIGVVITSAKKTFFAGGDLKGMIQAQPEDAGEFFSTVEGIKKGLRTLETFGKPVVAAINGAALGTRFKPAQAKEIGLVDEVLPTVEELVPAAKAWIKANPDSHTQPWDQKGYKMPGGTPSSPGLASILPSFPALLRKQLKGAPMPAPRAILDAAVEGAQVDFDTASRIERRYFTQLVTGQVAKNMIQALPTNHWPIPPPCRRRRPGRCGSHSVWCWR